MQPDAFWFTGPTRSGKTNRLVAQFQLWVQPEGQPLRAKRRDRSPASPTVLVFAANDDSRRDLADRLAAAIKGRFPILSKTPLGFFQDEVMLFWPLLIQRLNLRAQFPLRLRPETEQELATRLWNSDLEELWQGLPMARRVRRILDLLQLTALSGIPVEEIPSILEQGIVEESEDAPRNWEHLGKLLLRWQQWCLEQGLLTYGMICELYSRHLLPDAIYQQHLMKRYQAVLADDVDDYPAIARDLFDLLLNQGAASAFAYNPEGAVRLGLSADPQYMEGLSSRCRIEILSQPPFNSLAPALEMTVLEGLNDPGFLLSLPQSVQSIQTTSRATLLRQTCEAIAGAISSGQVQPQEIAVIGPGLDAIARYTLIDLLNNKGIPVESLNDQRPLISSPTIRALLTLLALVYPGLGRLVDRDAIAEMLVVLSTRQEGTEASKVHSNQQSTINYEQLADIDPVRAGLLADYCYSPDPEQPRLLSSTVFPRWDRLGHRATTAYERIVQWLEEQRSQQELRLIPSCVALLDRAIQQFLWNGSNLPFDQLSALRELMETAQHYWDVDTRLRQMPLSQGGIEDTPPHTTIGRFIQLLRQGTVTANPYPVRPLGPSSRAVTLATIFQYRAARRFHRWQFWLDAGSPLWSKGGAATLFGAPLFLKNWSGHPLTAEDEIKADEQRLQRILRDLLGRVGEKVYLCHSDLATNGQEQTGPLLSLVNASVPLGSELALS